MLKDSKYSKVLTIVLVVIIIGILICLGFLTYRFVSRYLSDKDNEEAIAAFTNGIRDRESDDGNDVLNTTDNSWISYDNKTNSSGGRTPISYNTNRVIGLIKIEKTKIEYPIYSEVTAEILNKAVGKAYGVKPNQVGNMVIAGHNYRDGRFFSDNKKLENGDKIYITDEDGNRTTYTIYNIYSTTPNDTSYYKRDTEGKREISLTTCSDDGKERLIIWAKE